MSNKHPMTDEEFRQHVADRVAALGVSPEAISERAGLNKSFVRQMMAGKGNPSRSNLVKLASALEWSVMDLLGQETTIPATRHQQPGMSEPEAIFVPESELTDIDMRMARMYPVGRADIMLVGSQSLLLKGYIPGDRILIDMNRKPVSGDAVVVQVYDDNAGTADTLLRIYSPPVLLPASTDAQYEMIAVGNDNATIKAVVVGRYNLSTTPAPAD